jgi:hypothetical protein
MMNEASLFVIFSELANVSLKEIQDEAVIVRRDVGITRGIAKDLENLTLQIKEKKITRLRALTTVMMYMTDEVYADVSLKDLYEEFSETHARDRSEKTLRHISFEHLLDPEKVRIMRRNDVLYKAIEGLKKHNIFDQKIDFLESFLE